MIPFLKTYVNLPAAIAFTGIYAKMTDSMELKNVFYALVVPFLIFFSAFALFIYPNRAIVHPHAMVDFLASKLPANFGAPLAIVRNWSFALFYVMAEMWGSVVTSLLFWGFANEVTTVEEAKKYYPLFGLGANVALIFSGQYVKWVSNMRATLAPGVDAWAVSLKYLMGAVLASGGVLMAAYKYMQDNIVSKSEEMKGLKKFPIKKKKTKMSMKESFQFLASSPYIRDLAILVVSYGMCINIVEVSWKAKLKQAYPDPNSYSAFMGNFSSATGAVTLVMMLLGRTIFEKFGWRVAAMVTPMVRCFCDHCNGKACLILSIDDWSYWPWLLCNQHLFRQDGAGCCVDWHDPASPCRLAWRRPEHSQQELQIFTVRSLQGDGLHSPGSRVEDEGQGCH